MRISILYILLCFPLFLNGGCKDKVKIENKHSVENSLPESAKDSTLIMTQGEGYNSFLYKFCRDSVFQLSRIIFPLQIESQTFNSFIEKSKWKHDFIFFNLQSFTEISYNKYFPNNPDSQTFSWINTNTLKSRNYYFCKNNSEWYLYKIGYNDESFQRYNENFYSFIGKFAKDSVFQRQRIQFPLKYDYLSSEMNDTSEYIFENKWFYSSVYFNCDSISNSTVNFGKSFGNLFDKFSNHDTIYFNIVGVENCISVNYKFVLKENSWFLINVQDLSN